MRRSPHPTDAAPDVARYLPLARREARLFSRRRSDTQRLGGPDALLSAAYRGLLTAKRRWTRERGTWAAYAKACIRWELQEHTEDVARFHKLPTLSLETLVHPGVGTGGADGEFRHPETLGDQALEPGDGPEALCVARVERRELSLTLGQAVSRLPDLEREVILMAFWDGLTGPEIAKRLDRCESRIYQLRRQAFQHLRELLGASLLDGASEVSE